MGRLSNRDVDALTQMQYEEALADAEPWANEAFDVRQAMALDGKRVKVEFDGGCTADGVWTWKGMTTEDFWLVYVVHPEDSTRVLVGCDYRSFDKIEVVG